MIFKDGIKPEWEDPVNAKGAHFEYKIKPDLSGGGGQIDEYWNNLVLGMIGSMIEPAQMITGVRLVDKLSGPRAAGVIRLEVWFSDADDKEAVKALQKNVEVCMQTGLDDKRRSKEFPKCETKTHG